MFLRVDERKIVIDDVFISYSPFLMTISHSGIQGDKDEEGYYVLDFKYEQFCEYVKFLLGEDFTLDGETAALFDILGHENRMEYPLDTWAVKLHDNWVRDNFEKFQLWQDPYFDLKWIRTCCMRKYRGPALPKGVYIAGGYALYLAGVTSKAGDIDFFTTDPTAALDFAENCNVQSQHPHLLELSPMTIDGQYLKAQLILRHYRSPSEIVHGFDLDCVGVLFDGRNLWVTKRTMHAIEKKMNWFDPSRASPSYAYRLSKYRTRGFDLFLPEVEADMDVLERFKREVARRFWVTLKHYFDCCGREDKHEDELSNLPFISPLLAYAPKRVNWVDIRNLGRMVNTEGSIWGFALHFILSHSSPEPGSYASIPKDPASVLLLSKHLGISSYHWKKSDYAPGKARDGFTGYDRKKVQWQVQNPGSQVSSTFYPTPIDDISEWWAQSPFVVSFEGDTLPCFQSYLRKIKKVKCTCGGSCLAMSIYREKPSQSVRPAQVRSMSCFLSALGGPVSEFSSFGLFDDIDVSDE